MFMTASATFGFIVWIVLWSVTQHGIVSFIPTVVIILIAATIKVLLPYLPNRSRH